MHSVVAQQHACVPDTVAPTSQSDSSQLLNWHLLTACGWVCACADRRLALKLHPDKCTAVGADEAFKRAFFSAAIPACVWYTCMLRTLELTWAWCGHMCAVVSKAFSCLSDGDKRAAYDRCNVQPCQPRTLFITDQQRPGTCQWGHGQQRGGCVLKGFKQCD